MGGRGGCGEGATERFRRVAQGATSATCHWCDPFARNYTHKYRRCQEPNWSCPSIATGELLDIERVTSSSERGGWKRTNYVGNAPAAYSTSRTVLKWRRGERSPRRP